MEPLPGCVVGVREDVLTQHNIKSEEFYLGRRGRWGLGHEDQGHFIFLVQGTSEKKVQRRHKQRFITGRRNDCERLLGQHQRALVVERDAVSCRRLEMTSNGLTEGVQVLQVVGVAGACEHKRSLGVSERVGAQMACWRSTATATMMTTDSKSKSTT